MPRPRVKRQILHSFVLAAVREASLAYQSSQQDAAAPGAQHGLRAALQLHPALLHPLPDRQVCAGVESGLLVRLQAQVAPLHPAELPLHPECVLPLTQAPACCAQRDML